MKVGKTQNTLELDEDIIEESVIHHVFDNAPIVFNENQNFKDYRNSDDVKNFVREKGNRCSIYLIQLILMDYMLLLM